MAQRNQLTTRPLERETLLLSMQREVIPYLRQTGQLVEQVAQLVEQVAPSTPPEIVGSRGGATVAVLTLVLTALDAAGIIKDSTTP